MHNAHDLQVSKASVEALRIILENNEGKITKIIANCEKRQKVFNNMQIPFYNSAIFKYVIERQLDLS